MAPHGKSGADARATRQWLDGACQDLVEVVAQTSGAPIVSLHRLGAGRAWHNLAAQTLQSQLAEDSGALLTVVASGEACELADRLVAGSPLSLDSSSPLAHLRSIAAFPVKGHVGILLGVLIVRDLAPRAVSRQRRLTLQRLARLAARLFAPPAQEPVDALLASRGPVATAALNNVWGADSGRVVADLLEGLVNHLCGTNFLLGVIRGAGTASPESLHADLSHAQALMAAAIEQCRDIAYAQPAFLAAQNELGMALAIQLDALNRLSRPRCTLSIHGGAIPSVPYAAAHGLLRIVADAIGIARRRRECDAISAHLVRREHDGIDLVVAANGTSSRGGDARLDRETLERIASVADGIGARINRQQRRLVHLGMTTVLRLAWDP